ncbi:MAG TPA: TIGR03085 family metal-binding protein [Acidimicrobiales bacterium]|nr:TIGR03085 family metal-binding protein [Acidimicrobiales bacterium]
MVTLPPYRTERNALSDLFQRLGPDAPTLCEGWRTVDLATHLVVRERKPLAAAGLVLGGPFRSMLEREMQRTKEANTYDALVALVRSGPPAFARPVDSLFNLTEFFVHHEDVRRGGGDTTPRPAGEIAGVEEALWRSLRRGAMLAARNVHGAGLELRRPDGQVLRARRGTPTATLVGRAGELVLYLSGRGASAHVDLDGPPEALSAIESASFGI